MMRIYLYATCHTGTGRMRLWMRAVSVGNAASNLWVMLHLPRIWR